MLSTCSSTLHYRAPPFHGHDTCYLTSMHGLIRREDFWFKGSPYPWIHRQLHFTRPSWSSFWIISSNTNYTIWGDKHFRKFHKWSRANNTIEFDTTFNPKSQDSSLWVFFLIIWYSIYLVGESMHGGQVRMRRLSTI